MSLAFPERHYQAQGFNNCIVSPRFALANATSAVRAYNFGRSGRQPSAFSSWYWAFCRRNRGTEDWCPTGLQPSPPGPQPQTPL